MVNQPDEHAAAAAEPGRLAQFEKALRNSPLLGRLLPSSLLNFIAGLLAGAGINMLTSVEAGPTSVPTHKIVIDSLGWVAAAGFSAAAAHRAETAERRADLAYSESYGPDLNRAIRREKAAEVAGLFWLFLLLGLACIGFAVSRIP